MWTPLHPGLVEEASTQGLLDDAPADAGQPPPSPEPPLMEEASTEAPAPRSRRKADAPAGTAFSGDAA